MYGDARPDYETFQVNCPHLPKSKFSLHVDILCVCVRERMHVWVICLYTKCQHTLEN